MPLIPAPPCLRDLRTWWISSPACWVPKRTAQTLTHFPNSAFSCILCSERFNFTMICISSMGMVASPGSSGCCFTKTISLSVSSGTSLGRNHVLMAELLNVAEHWLQYAFEPALSDGRHHLKNDKQCSIAERLSENRPQIFGASEAFFTQRMGFRWQARIETRSFPLVVRVYFSGAACFASGVLHTSIARLIRSFFCGCC